MSRSDLKIVLLGHEAVGKSSLMERFVNDKFNTSLCLQNTIGSAFASKEITIVNKKLVLDIWDTAGSERYEAMTKLYYRGAAAAIVCYDVTNPETFSKARFWIRELRSIEENCIVYLCATKGDLLQNLQVANPTLDVVQKYANGVQLKFFLTSSKTGENVGEIFQVVAEDYISNPKNANNLENITLHTDKTRNNQHTRCCFS